MENDIYVYRLHWNPVTKRTELIYEFTIDRSRLPDIAKKRRRERYGELRKEFEVEGDCL